MIHKESLRVSINAKGRGEIDSFVAGYSMRDHYEGLAQKHGASVAEKLHGLDRHDYVISIATVENTSLDKKVADFIGVDGVTKGQYVIDKIINPLQSCFRNYRIIEIDGELIAVSSSNSFGWRYGKVIKEWVKEAGEFSSIALAA